ncbi:type IV toxin-antitoxin system AbiEi family antitoxin domain-containing protein [Tersicoccus sp. MR15.9]|uniref:type IV toxin-antitoxin system AbiEi family antitoxin domain-containing protein n=1 Tax=Tersicoccus mangrovi TaxID=3121635 RepID=UPI002FE6BF5F
MTEGADVTEIHHSSHVRITRCSGCIARRRFSLHRAHLFTPRCPHDPSRALSGQARGMGALEIHLARHWGVIRARDLRSLGVGPRELRRLIDAGTLMRCARGVYAAPSAERDVVHAARRFTTLTCLSACHAHGLWVWHQPFPPHVLRADGPPIRGAVVHRGVRDPHEQVAGVLDALVTAFRCAPPREAIVAAESAVVQHRITVDDLVAAFPGQRDRRIRASISRIRATGQSLPETLARLALEDAGLTMRPQVFIEGVGHVDGMVDGLVCEIDGRAFHSGPVEFEEDRRRWNALMELGIPTVRIPARWVLADPDAAVVTVRRVLARRGG